MSGTIGFNEQITRYVVGALLIVLSVFTMQIPLWFAFVATYPIFTAMVQWDPLYALFDTVRRQFSPRAASILEAYASS